MTAQPGPPPAPAVEETRKELRKKLPEFLLAIPFAMVPTLVGALFGFDLKTHPYGALILTATFLLVAYIGWQLLKGVQGYTLSGPFRWLFTVYMLLFTLAASHDVLNWRQELLGYRDNIPRNFLALNRLGDWHYRFAPDLEAPQDILILTVPLAENRVLEDTRATLMFLIQSARLHGAKAVGLDFYFDLESQVDRNFCEVIDEAWREKMPVLAGYRHAVDETLVRPIPTSPSLPCLKADRLGHLAAYRERDARVRMVPVDLGGIENFKSLSHKLVLATTEEPLQVPETRLVQFVKPSSGIPVISYEDLRNGRRSWEVVRGRTLLVGGDTPEDRHSTPYGEILGVMLHGYSMQALRSGQFIRRPSWLWSFPWVFFSCYLLSAWFMRGVGLPKLAGAALLLHLAYVAMAALAMRLWLVWLDVIYLGLSIWLFVLLLWLVGRRLRTSQAAPVPAPTPAAAPP